MNFIKDLVLLLVGAILTFINYDYHDSHDKILTQSRQVQLMNYHIKNQYFVLDEQTGKESIYMGFMC